MYIDFEYETKDIIDQLKQAEGFLAAEKVILFNILKHIEQGHSDKVLEDYMENLFLYFQEINNSPDNISNYNNFQYAVGLLKTLLTTT